MLKSDLPEAKEIPEEKTEEEILNQLPFPIFLQ
jgi:hypothetical protein